jgi:hypothetical protein
MQKLEGTMRKLIATLVLMIVSSGAVAQVTYMNGLGLLEQCASEEKVQQGTCIGYLYGVIDLMKALKGASVFNKYYFCVPNGVTGEQLRVVTIRYLKNNPEKLQADGSSLIFTALGEVFPCEK